MAKVKLGIEAVTPGMRLAEPLADANGATLMPAGIRLTPLFITRIKKWGLASVEVLAEDAAGGGPPGGTDGFAAPVAPTAVRVGPDGAKMPPEMEEFVRAVASEVSGRFAGVKDNPLMARLRSAAVRALVAHGRSGWLNLMRARSARKEGEAPNGH